MSASFHLEMAVFPDSGVGGTTNTNNQASGTALAAAGGQGLTFNRRSTVSLAGPFGEVRIGRDFDPAFYNLTYGDVFGSAGAGQAVNFSNGIVTSTLMGARVSNSITYWTPQNSTGFGAQATYFLGENAGNLANSKDGNGGGARVWYDAGGNFSAGIAVNRTVYAAGDATQRNVYAGYKYMDCGKVVADLSRDSVGAVNAKGGAVGVTYPVGAHVLRAAYSWYGANSAGNPKVKRYAVGDVYYFSKRTWAYLTYAHQPNSGGSSAALNGAVTAPNTISSALELGYVVTF